MYLTSAELQISALCPTEFCLIPPFLAISSCRILSKLGRHDEAAKHYAAMTQMTWISEETREAYYLSTTRELRADKQYAKALKIIEDRLPLTKLESIRDYLKKERREILEETGDITAYLDELKRRAEKGDDQDALKELAEYYVTQRQYPEGAKYYSQLAEIAPRSEYFKQWVLLGYHSRDWEDVVVAYKKWYEKLPADKGRDYYTLMAAHHGLGNREETIDVAEDYALQAGKHSGYALYHIVGFMKDFEEYELAAKYLKQAIGLKPLNKQWKTELIELERKAREKVQ